MGVKDEEKKGIQSIESGFSIVKAVSLADEPLTITELSKLCDMPKSQIYRYLISLCRIGFLEKGPDLRYSLGNELTSIGLHAMKKVDIRVKALPYIKKLNELLDETVALAIWIEKEGPIFITWEESRKPININVRIGSVVPLATSATGNVFAAFYPPEKTKELIDRELRNNHMERSALDSLLSTVKKDQYAYTESHLPGITAISAPVFDQKKDLVAALSIIGLSGVLDSSKNSIATTQLLKTAEELSSKLGYLYL
ncbi:IclR family transcriptional regulator [Domibacillus epiphyticus]|uniref:IclR family transcriptional regulator n=1 Tax=Domibacillus epiphyticus TaxID=1714355 RepID=A0A1V2A664_9BACI|nr:IclR family transcriptional regulator [Domibacillus epiphyticus]OMP66499.1 hypothetical protein BTO28_12455 [Domibacillus epiphyticus]